MELYDSVELELAKTLTSQGFGHSVTEQINLAVYEITDSQKNGEFGEEETGDAENSKH